MNVLNERYERYKVDKCCSIVVAALADGQFGNRVQSEDSFSCTEVFISKRANVQDPVRETGPFDNTHGGKDWSSLMQTADYHCFVGKMCLGSPAVASVRNWWRIAKPSNHWFPFKQCI